MRVLIAGAGPSGLALAKALTLKGASCTVFERQPSIVPSACFALGLNGAVACRAIGLLEPVTKFIRPVRFNVIQNYDGSILARSADMLKAHNCRDIPTGIMKRQEFCEVAVKALPDGIVRFSSNVIASDDLGSDGVRVTLEDGTVESGDVFVGADGVGSRTRDSLFPPAELKWSGFNLYYGLTDVELLQPSEVPPPETVTLCYGRTGNHYAVRFNLGEEVYWGCYERGPPPEVMGASDYHAEDKTRLLAKLDHWEDDELKAAIRHAKTLVRTEHYIPPSDYLSDAWHRGSIAVIGDAAHKVMPFTSQGLNMGLDDALCLARCLVTLPTEKALREYHRTRYLRTVDTRDKAVKMGEVQLPTSAWKRSARSFTLRLLNATGLYSKVALRALEEQVMQAGVTEEEAAAFEGASPLGP